jgi:hypothetical protein
MPVCVVSSFYTRCHKSKEDDQAFPLPSQPLACAFVYIRRICASVSGRLVCPLRRDYTLTHACIHQATPQTFIVSPRRFQVRILTSHIRAREHTRTDTRAPTHAGQTEKVTVDTTAAVNGNVKPPGANMHPRLPRSALEGLVCLGWKRMREQSGRQSLAWKVRGHGLESSEEFAGLPSMSPQQ